MVEYEKIRKKLLPHRGRKVRLTATGDRNRKVECVGILTGVYPGLFTVEVEEVGYRQKYSYTYGEMVTGKVRLSSRGL